MSEEKIMGFEEILGNEMVKDHFKKAIQNHKISHASPCFQASCSSTS